MDKDTRDKLIVVAIAAVFLCGLKYLIDFLPMWLVEFLREIIVNF